MESSTPRAHFTPGKDPLPFYKENVGVLIKYYIYIYIYIYMCVCVCVCVCVCLFVHLLVQIIHSTKFTVCTLKYVASCFVRV